MDIVRILNPSFPEPWFFIIKIDKYLYINTHTRTHTCTHTHTYSVSGRLFCVGEPSCKYHIVFICSYFHIERFHLCEIDFCVWYEVVGLALFTPLPDFIYTTQRIHKNTWATIIYQCNFYFSALKWFLCQVWNFRRFLGFILFLAPVSLG